MFTDASRAAAGKIASRLWDLDDGPPATEPAVAHPYLRAGVYRVTLIVWDEAGRGARCEQSVRVAE